MKNKKNDKLSDRQKRQLAVENVLKFLFIITILCFQSFLNTTDLEDTKLILENIDLVLEIGLKISGLIGIPVGLSKLN